MKVIGSGKTNLKLKNAEGVEFEAKDFIFNKLDNPNQTQNITFTAVENQKLMPNTITSDFTMSGDGARFLIKDNAIIKFNLEKKPVAYTIDCNNIKSNRSTIILDTYHIIVPVNVTVAGEYELNTKPVTVDGFEFSSTVNGVKAKFDFVGLGFAYLYPKNKNLVARTKGNNATIIVNNDGNTVELCSPAFNIKVGWKELVILYIVNTDDGSQHKFDFWMKNLGLFGETGKYVETGKITVDKYALSDRANEMDVTVQNKIV